ATLKLIPRSLPSTKPSAADGKRCPRRRKPRRQRHKQVRSRPLHERRRNDECLMTDQCPCTWNTRSNGWKLARHKTFFIRWPSPGKEFPMTAPLDPAPPPRRKRAIALVVFLIVAALAGVGGFFYWQHSSQFEETDDAFVDGNITTVSPQVAGRVTKV